MKCKIMYSEVVVLFIAMNSGFIYLKQYLAFRYLTGTKIVAVLSMIILAFGVCLERLLSL